MKDKTVERVISFLVDCILDSSFGDGQEEEMIRDGRSFKGLNNMTDKELLDELLCYTGENEELVLLVKKEMADKDFHKTVNEELG